MLVYAFVVCMSYAAGAASWALLGAPIMRMFKPVPMSARERVAASVEAYKQAADREFRKSLRHLRSGDYNSAHHSKNMSEGFVQSARNAEQELVAMPEDEGGKLSLIKGGRR